VCRRAEARVRRELRTVLPWRRPTVRIVDIDVPAGAVDGPAGAPVADPVSVAAQGPAEGPTGGLTTAGLIERYSVRVPVVTLDGREISELELTPGVVRAAVKRRRRPR
jgi:hypothetical protein